MKSALIWLLLLCNLGIGPVEQVNDPDVPVQDPVEWQAPDPVVIDPTTSAWLKENLEHVTLEIYYMNPWRSTRAPASIYDLKRWSDLQVTVDGETLVQHKELIAQMLDTPAKVSNDKAYLDARIYYALRDDTGKVLFDMAMWGWGPGVEDIIFINGIPCAEDSIYYDAIMGFLPANAATEFQIYVEKDYERMDELEKMYQEFGGKPY